MSVHGLEHRASSSFTTLNDFEAWVGQNWLYPRGSEAAMTHVRGKLGEEIVELSDALTDGSPEDIREEGGDVLWTATAQEINEGLGLNHSFQHSSWHHLMPEGDIPVSTVDQVAQRRWTRPHWQRSDGLVVGDLNESRRTIQKYVRAGDVEATRDTLRILAAQLSGAASMLHTIVQLDDRIRVPELTRSDSPCTWIDIAYVGESLTQLFIVCSSIARVRLGTGLSDMMEANRQKLQQRIAQGAPITKLPLV